MKSYQIIIENVELDFTGLPEGFKGLLLTYPSHYQEWGIREIKKGEHAESILDAVKYYIEKVKDNRYKEILKKVTPEPKNILTLTLKQVEDAQQKFERTYTRQSKREIRRQLVKGYTTTLVDKPGLKIIKVEKKDYTNGAAKIAADLVGGAHWCVVNVETGDDYLKRDPLYFIYIGNKRYLCHLSTVQLMNVNNKPFMISKKTYDLLSPYIPDIGIFMEDKSSEIYENTIMKSPRLAYEHAMFTIKRRWPEAEPYIMKEPEYACNYAIFVLKRRWPEAEPHIIKDPGWANYYAHDIIKGMGYADRWLEAEPTIMKDPESAYKYARDVIKDMWPEAELYVMSDPQYACWYAADILKGRWPEAEPYIMKDPRWAYNYTHNIIKKMGHTDRWLEAEPYIMKHPWVAYLYARDVLKRRWPEAEPYIQHAKVVGDENVWLAKDPWQLYKEIFNIIYY